MGVRLEGTSAGILGTTYTVQIHDSEYIGTVIDVQLGGEGFNLSYEPSEERPDAAIIASSLNFSIIRTSATASAFDSFISDFIGADEGRFTVKVLDSDDALFWCGYILADQVKYLDPRWADSSSIFSFKAKDGLNRLKAIDYRDESGAYEGRVPFSEHLLNCLSKIGLLDFWGADDDFLHALVRWYTLQDPTATLNDNILFRAYVDHLALISVASNGQNEYKSAYDVLEAICTIFGARIFLSAGVWHFEQFNEYRETGDLYLHRYKKDFSKISTDSSVSYEVDEAAGDFITAASGVVSFLAPVRRIDVLFEHRDDRNYLRGIDLAEDGPVTFTFVPAKDSKYRLSGLLRTRALFAPATEPLPDLVEAHKPVYVVIGFRISYVFGSTTYYLNRQVSLPYGVPIYSLAEWSTSGLYRVAMPLQSLPDFVSEQINFITPEFPEDTSSIAITVDVEYVSGFSPQGDVLDLEIDNFTFDFIEGIFQAMNVDGSFPSTSNNAYRNNPDSPNASEKIEKKALFADGIAFLGSAAISVLDDGEHIRTTQWSKGISITGQSIQGLLSEEILYQRKKSIRTIDAIFYEKSPINFYNVLKLNTGEQFIPLNSTYNSRREQWAGRYTSIGYSDTLTGVSVVIDVPIGPDPSTGGTPPGDGPQVVPGVGADNPIGGSFDNGGHIVSTSGTSPIGGGGDVINEIPIVSTGVDGLILSGDEVAVVDPISGATQVFTVAADVSATDTVISISSAVLNSDFGEGSYVTLPTGTFVSNIKESAIIRYVQKFDNPASSTLTVTENAGVLPADTNQVDVYYNGVLLSETDDYTISGSNIILTFMPKRRVIVKFIVFN